jgi:hypothetical protein
MVDGCRRRWCAAGFYSAFSRRRVPHSSSEITACRVAFFGDPAPARDAHQDRGPGLCLSRALEIDASHSSASLPPKSADPGPLALFSCKRGAFVGSAKGTIMRFMDPLAAHLWSAAAG